MNLEEIKKAIESGKKVYCGNKAYEVIKDSKGQYFIYCILTGAYMNLTEYDVKDCFVEE